MIETLVHRPDLSLFERRQQFYTLVFLLELSLILAL